MCPANISTSPVKLTYTAGKISTCPDWKISCPVGHVTTNVYVPCDRIYMPRARLNVEPYLLGTICDRATEKPDININSDQCCWCGLCFVHDIGDSSTIIYFCSRRSSGKIGKQWCSGLRCSSHGFSKTGSNDRGWRSLIAIKHRRNSPPTEMHKWPKWHWNRFLWPPYFTSTRLNPEVQILPERATSRFMKKLSPSIIAHFPHVCRVNPMLGHA